MDSVWSDARTECLDVALNEDDSARPGSTAKRALAALRQMDDVEQTAVLGLNVAAMEADRL